MDRTASLIAADKAHVWHPFTQMKAWCDGEPLVLVDGEGALLRDSEGREYIDGNSSIWTNIHGHKNPKIDAAIRAQLDRVAHVSFLGTTNEPAIQLAEKLVGLFPAGTLDKVFYSDDGSTAIEVALKMSLQYWQLIGQPSRRKFVAFDDAYHGDTAGASSLGGVSAFTSRFAAVHFDVQRVKSVADLDQLDASEISAIIIEPLVQGAAGIRLWPDGMLKALRAWCDRTGVLLIFDEVLTGFGRTGKMFACEHEAVLPDFLCLAKGLTGGYLPLAVTLTTSAIYDAFLGEVAEGKTFYYGHSYCGNPLGCAAAIASLEIFETEKTLDALQGKIARMNALLDGLKSSSHVFEIRSRGFIAGIEVRRSSGEAYPWQELVGARICAAARNHGLLTRPILDTIVLMPPYCITDAQLERAVGAIAAAIRDICEN